MRGAGALAHDAFMTDSHQSSGRTPSITELIALGRDREAVDAATRDSRARPTQSRPNEVIERAEPMDGVQQLDEIIPLLEGLVDQFRPDQLESPTPCANFTVSSVETEAPPAASPLERLVAFAGRQLPNKETQP